MRPRFVAALGAALVIVCSGEASAQDSVSEAEQARDFRNTCIEAAATKAKAKKVSPDTFKLILDGACNIEVAAAHNAFVNAMDASTPAGLSIDPGPTKARYVRAFDQQFESMKAKMVSDFALEG